MKPALESLNSLAPKEAAGELLKCCGSTRWANLMAEQRPFKSMNQLLEAADKTWWGLEPRDWLEAFSRHPKIGERKAVLAQSTEAARWSEQEQRGTSDARQEALLELSALNRAYEERFGFIFIVCATGKTTPEMLALLKERLRNDYDKELRIAAGEQRRITHLRLDKLLEQ